ncbi:unnamed protein product [Rotaria sp. Silwood1]|nr:unnamed protein product [Rotaria sp. Silwood1]CAF1659560.1 unnamed protein product [Rotaria sp. Silwood1]
MLSGGDNLSLLSSISLNNEEKVPINVNATAPIVATIRLELKIENNSNIIDIVALQLSIESKIIIEELVESISSQCINGFNSENENFIQKLNQISLSITRTDSTRSISSSLHLS